MNDLLNDLPRDCNLFPRNYGNGNPEEPPMEDDVSEGDIANEADLLRYLEADARETAIRHVYKYTDCGAWIVFEATGIKLGSIVEGADFGTSVYPLNYPFSGDDYNARIKAIEEESSLIWDWANSDDANDTDAPSYAPIFKTSGRSS